MYVMNAKVFSLGQANWLRMS